MSKRDRFILIALAILAIIIIGTAGYMIIEGWSFSDRFFMGVITLSTVGFSEVHPLSEGGRYFTIFRPGRHRDDVIRGNRDRAIPAGGEFGKYPGGGDI